MLLSKALQQRYPHRYNIIAKYMKSGGGEQFIATTGVKQKRVASESVTSSDLCFEAAEKLIAELNWEKAEIDALVFVTQSPDYRTPGPLLVFFKIVWVYRKVALHLTSRWDVPDGSMV